MFQAIFDLLILNDYTPAIYQYFGWHEDHWIIDLVFTAKGL